MKKIFKRHSSFYWPNAKVGYMETIYFLTSYTENRFDQSDWSSASRAVESLTRHAPKILCG